MAPKSSGLIVYIPEARTITFFVLFVCVSKVGWCVVFMVSYIAFLVSFQPTKFMATRTCIQLSGTIAWTTWLVR